MIATPEQMGAGAGSGGDGDAQGFLGEEFLTWLWYRVETEGGDFEVGRESIAVLIDDYIAFAPHEADETEQLLKKGLPTRTVEARAGLRSGRRLRRAKLLVARGEDEWSLVLDGPSMALQNIRIPADSEDAANNPVDRKNERVEHFLDVHDLVFGLYELFLRDRLRPEYLATSGAEQAAWMSGG
jgi:hypothetical protein